MTEREAIEALGDLLETTREYPHLDGMTMFGDAIKVAISALEKQEQSCDTCKHGYFGDAWCERCAVRFASHYEAEEEE